jgi:ABC-type branched-subunit amino acid transport system ATPase component
MTVIGGIGVLPGALIGALYIVGIPAFVDLDAAGLAASAFGWLVLILYYPAGLAGLFRPVRDRLVYALARRAGVDPETAQAKRGIEEPLIQSPLLAKSKSQVERPKEDRGVLLEARDLRKRYGGIVAVDGVSLQIFEGETVGIIGPNGAGKTTLFELISGFTRSDRGEVLFEGKDVSALSPERRGRLGLVRSFQDAFLFPTLSVLETVKLALEKIWPSSVLIELAGWRRTERLKDGRARELIHLMGLDAFRNKQVAELSTGTRRITELAALIAAGPKLLLLDEPSSGIAQRETEALVDVLARLKSYLGTTLVVIEHDMPLISALSDRMLAMESGKVIAEGTPNEVENNQLVVNSYLGEDVRAIRRSDLAPRRS